MTEKKIALVGMSCLALALCRAQSINISMEEGGQDPRYGPALPSASFGAAAGQPGLWNSCVTSGRRWGGPGLSSDFTTELHDVSGFRTSVILTSANGAGGGWWNPNIYNNTAGDYAALMTDARIVGVDKLTFSGLIPGYYDVYTYSVMPNNHPGGSLVSVKNSTSKNPQWVTGPLNGNSFGIDRTHAVHRVYVGLEGRIELEVSAKVYQATTAVNGIQLVFLY